MGQTKMVPLHVCTFIGITGNGVEIAEDMARRLLNTRLDAKMENPEERKFRPGFLDDILAQRPSLLSDLLTIWRWGRQNPGVLEAGRPLGSYETWAQWVRDPLLTLGLRDPVERIAEIKANDPKRRALVELFDLWHKKHKEEPVRAAQLDPEVIQLIDIRARKKDDGSLQYSRQRVARFLTQRAGTRVGGYVLTQGKEGPESKEIAVYTLVRNTPEPAGRDLAPEAGCPKMPRAATPPWMGRRGIRGMGATLLRSSAEPPPDPAAASVARAARSASSAEGATARPTRPISPARKRLGVTPSRRIEGR